MSASLAWLSAVTEAMMGLLKTLQDVKAVDEGIKKTQVLGVLGPRGSTLQDMVATRKTWVRPPQPDACSR